jgi:hypothetical protein
MIALDDPSYQPPLQKHYRIWHHFIIQSTEELNQMEHIVLIQTKKDLVSPIKKNLVDLRLKQA